MCADLEGAVVLEPEELVDDFHGNVGQQTCNLGILARFEDLK